MAETAAVEPTVQDGGTRTGKIKKIGKVISNKMDKTVIVAVDYRRQHPLYRKTMTRTHAFAAHDAANSCEIGDIVEIEESRPLSKTKRWVVREIIQRSDRV
jgi:small subunit ribosomal protein S17